MAVGLTTMSCPQPLTHDCLRATSLRTTGCSDLASASHRGGAPRRFECLAAIGAVPLDRRSPLNDLMASLAFE